MVTGWYPLLVIVRHNMDRGLTRASCWAFCLFEFLYSTGYPTSVAVGALRDITWLFVVFGIQQLVVETQVPAGYPSMRIGYFVRSSMIANHPPFIPPLVVCFTGLVQVNHVDLGRAATIVSPFSSGRVLANPPSLVFVSLALVSQDQAIPYQTLGAGRCFFCPWDLLFTMVVGMAYGRHSMRIRNSLRNLWFLAADCETF